MTTENTKPITQSTLLVGSSILKGVRVQDLKTDTAVRSFSGARVDTIGAKLSKYNIEECKTLILHVGGNDADSGVDLESFDDNYVSLLNDLSADDRRIIVSGLTPRASVDLKPFNQKLKSICEENNLQFIDNYDRFLLASGEMPESYFQHDKTHLNVSGTRKLLTNIDAVHRVTKTTASPGNKKPTHGFRPNRGHLHARGYSTESRTGSWRKYCHICARNGHNTQECWYNGRGTPMGRMGPW